MGHTIHIDRLYTYVMTYDTGFAPNPFFGVCTLACCKPLLRENVAKHIEKSTSGVRNKKDISSLNIWVAGFASKELANKSKYHSADDLIYIMKVTDIATIEEYSKDPKYRCKIPNPDYFTVKRKNYGTENASFINCGDNIYIYTDHGIQQRPSFHKNCGNSCTEEMKKDLSGGYVLISDKYIYFGETPIKPGDFHIKGRKGYSWKYSKTEKDSFAAFLSTLDFTKSIQGKPTECAVNFDIGV